MFKTLLAALIISYYLDQYIKQVEQARLSRRARRMRGLS